VEIKKPNRENEMCLGPAPAYGFNKMECDGLLKFVGQRTE
jgi:hypothetical protein